MFDSLLNMPLTIAAVLCTIDEKELFGTKGDWMWSVFHRQYPQKTSGHTNKEVIVYANSLLS